MWQPRVRQVIVSLVLLVFLAQVVTVFAVDPDYVGYAYDDETGEPISGAKVDVYYRRHRRWYSSRWYPATVTETDMDGRFELNFDEGYSYRIVLSHQSLDDHDYVPYVQDVEPSGSQINQEFKLWRSEKVSLVGRDFFIETTAIPELQVRVQDTETGSSFNYGSLGLLYGDEENTLSYFLELPAGTVYVPQDKRYSIGVDAFVEIDGVEVTETLQLDAIEFQGLEEVSLRTMALPLNLEKTLNITHSTRTLIEEKENEGFYLSVQRQKISRTETLTASAGKQIESGNYDDAFNKLRESYILLSDLNRSVASLEESATRSVFILVMFIGVSAQVMAALLYETRTGKLAVGSVVFVALLLVLFWLHPGAQITDTTELARMGAVTWVSVTVLTLAIPFLLQRGKKTGSPNIRHMTLPILSIAKRSLRRRKLRFILTLTSILLLVASFISLTSFSSGYGLSISQIHEGQGKTGVTIRTPDPPPTKSAAPFSGGIGVSGTIPLDESTYEWFKEDESIQQAVPKYENRPMRQYRESNQPVTRVEGIPIFGLISVDPSYEAETNNLDSALVAGNYLSDDEGEILISVVFAETLGVGVGDVISFNMDGAVYDFTVTGLMEDTLLETVQDIDGESLLPSKIIEWHRVEYDGPDYVVEALVPCDPNEVLIVSHASSVNMTSLEISRLNLVLGEDADVVEYARITALTRGFRAWSQSDEGIYLAQLVEYFDGKGLPVMIPWVIVVLNVVVTMMNAYYERKDEVMIFSSIGMNPRQISSIFLAEAGVTGVLGGCLGYLLGLGAYKFIYMVTPELQVQQKVSAVWSLGAIGISLAAVLIGGLFALRNSVSITPSLQRRWKLESKGSERITRIELPVHVFPEELEEFKTFIEERLRARESGVDVSVRMLKENEDGFSFFYGTEGPNISRLYSRNQLTIMLEEDETYHAVLFSDGDTESVRTTGVVMRQICLEWGMEREEH